MEHTPYDDLINIALDKRDFEWVTELQQQKDEFINQKPKTQKKQDSITYTDEIIALEDIYDIYVIKENHGIRNIIMNSTEDIKYGNLAYISEKKWNKDTGLYVKQGDKIQYGIVDSESQAWVRLYLQGYANGFNKGYDCNYWRQYNIEKGTKIFSDYINNLIKRYKNQ